MKKRKEPRIICNKEIDFELLISHCTIRGDIKIIDCYIDGDVKIRSNIINGTIKETLNLSRCKEKTNDKTKTASKDEDWNNARDAYGGDREDE